MPVCITNDRTGGSAREQSLAADARSSDRSNRGVIFVDRRASSARRVSTDLQRGGHCLPANGSSASQLSSKTSNVRAPLLDAPLERAELDAGEGARMPSLECLEHGPPGPRGISGEKLLDLARHRRERVG